MTGLIVLEENMSSLEKREMDLLTFIHKNNCGFLMLLTHSVIEY